MRLNNQINTIAATLFIAVASLSFNAHADDKPWLGVAVEDLTFDVLDEHGLSHGVLVENVYDGSAASTSGLMSGDVLLGFDDLPLFSVERLQWLVARKSVGDQISLSYFRGGERGLVELTLGSWSVYLSEHHGKQHQNASGEVSKSYIGVHLQNLSDGMRGYFSAPEGVGMLVADVGDGTAAAMAGIQPGDVLLNMGSKVISNFQDVQRVLDFFDPGEQLTVEVLRNKQRLAVDIVVGSQPVVSEEDRTNHLFPEDWHQNFHQNWHHKSIGHQDELGMLDGMYHFNMMGEDAVASVHHLWDYVYN